MEAAKRRRLQGACDSCRSRKKACDSAQRPGAKCSNCQAFGSECTHLAAKSRKSGAIPTNSLGSTELEDIQVHIAAILSTTTPYTVPKESRTVRPVLIELARYARDLEARLAAVEQKLAESQSPSPASEVQTMEESMTNLVVSESKNRHYGAVDDAKFITTAIDLKEGIDPDHTLRRPEFWTRPYWQVVPKLPLPPLHFPPPDLLEDLVTIFLDTMNPYICLLHAPSFRRDIAHGVHYASREFGSVVLAVCAVASRSSADPRIAAGHRAGWEWYHQLRPIEPVTMSGLGCLWDLQLIVLMVMHLYAMAIADEIWYFVALGIRLAQDMGVHRKRRRSRAAWTPLDESLNRAWWSLITIDVYASSMFGRTRTTNSDEFDAEYPLEVDDECWPDELLADPTQPWTQPLGAPSKITSWVLHLKLLEIYSFAQGTIYSVKRSEFWDALSTVEWDHNVAVALDSAMNKWIDAIPEHLRWDPHTPSEAAAYLYTSYYWVQIQIHRPFIRGNRHAANPAPPSSASFSSVAICTNAARSCSHVFGVHHRAFGTIPMSTMFATMLHLSIILLLNAADGVLATERDLEDVRMMMDMLKSHEGRWQVAGRYHDVIRELFVLLKVPDDVGNPKKRKDVEVDFEHDHSQLLAHTLQDADAHVDWTPALDWNVGTNWNTNWNREMETGADSWNPAAWQDFGAYLSGADELLSGRPY